MTAKFIGVGVGPGDPELITLKACRYIQHADVISYIANEQGISQAKSIAQEALKQARSDLQEIPLLMPMQENRTQANSVYDDAAVAIQQAVTSGLTVVFLCEGDPLFFGSFGYLLERLKGNVPCEVVPGISSVHAASSALQHPLTVLTESFSVVSGRHSQDKIESALRNNETVVIMKAGRSRQRILQALHATQRTSEAQYLEYIGRDQERICDDVSSLEGEAGPYFSLFVVTSRSRCSR